MKKISFTEYETEYEKLIVNFVDYLKDKTQDFLDKNCINVNQRDILNMLKDGTLAFSMNTFQSIVRRHIRGDEDVCEIVDNCKKVFEAYIKETLDENLGRKGNNA